MCVQLAHFADTGMVSWGCMAFVYCDPGRTIADIFLRFGNIKILSTVESPLPGLVSWGCMAVV